jgi:DNA-binding MarR family transcriptional regulator/GNAT superfamily N-acetyltransferase
LPSASNTQTPPQERVAAVRGFNRFYTRVLGLLREGLLDTPYSLTEARAIFELAQADAIELTELRRSLGIDAGYLSRLVSRLEGAGLVTRERSAADGRRQLVRLTGKGRSAFELLDRRSGKEIARLLEPLGDDRQRRLVGAMGAIRELLEDSPRDGSLVLRPPGPGDLGWIVQRHGAIYAEEYGWDETFEALVARIVSDYAERRDRRRERGWIAEVDGEPVGCVFCMRETEKVAKLRLLLVEPRARGMGIGGRLVDECLRFARTAGYREVTLWTNDVLDDARRIYERSGFELAKEDRHRSFGHELVGQHWRRPL